MKSITIKDVAKNSKVSATTVSRVIHGNSKVSPKVREKVLETIKSLNYFPNENARAIVNKRTNVIGLVLTDISNPFYPTLLRGIENTINKSNFSMILCNTDENPTKEERFLRILLEKRIDGLIIVPTGPDISFLKTFEARNIPIVCVDRVVRNVETDSVVVDNFHGAFIATEKLIQSSHQRIAIIGGNKNIFTIGERFRGYTEALDTHGIVTNQDYIKMGGFTIEDYEQDTLNVFSLATPPTAVFSAGNLSTIGIYIALNKMKKKIPRDVSIVGFDDLVWVEALTPPLTAISQPIYQIGATSAQLLLQRMLHEGPSEKQNIMLSTSLVIRESC
ncbi:MAG: LacI family DNA-binding transcriptional regulator [Candidatus Atribacteria bacterium]|nr:LacI family DNA-binding transcriptional regulator [Candidatus Atribacteria bacterium]